MEQKPLQQILLEAQWCLGEVRIWSGAAVVERAWHDAAMMMSPHVMEGFRLG